MNKKIIALLVLAAAPVFATDAVLFEDFDYSISGNTVVKSGSIKALWGTYSNSVFTPISGTNSGYFALSGDDSSVNLGATTNANVLANTLISLGFFDIAASASFGTVTGATAYAVLTDPSWIAPTFSTSPGAVTVSFTNNTVASFGTFSRTGANDVITLKGSAIPEPSTYAAFAGLAVLGLAASRRRRQA